MVRHETSDRLRFILMCVHKANLIKYLAKTAKKERISRFGDQDSDTVHGRRKKINIGM